ncbi:RICIN domain-containing protein [Streptomyces sp. NPDC048507]|uniref:RICIN domain-containing protein n=1 Tax=Streptomyces sp. NPDC048507 TaxID=3365560 RepID=UPI00371CFB5C
MKARITTAAALAALGTVLIATPAVANPDPGFPQNIRNEQTGRCLDSDQAGKVYTNPCTANNPYQQWISVNLGTDYYFSFKNVATGKCLTGVSEDTVRTMSCAEGSYRPQRWGTFNNGRSNQLWNANALDSDDKGNVYLKESTPNNRYQSWLYGNPR